MKTATIDQNVQRSGVSVENTFQIKANGKAFRILSDGLYSDKITAIIRELSCNAYDAHVEAGNADTKFIIHLPNRLEPHFSIRDFGVGLTHKDLTTVYTTYFESTKTNSNDYIGCLGLGSKSPFSYVDNFTIVSYKDGEKRTYSAFLNEESCPSIVLMNTEKTTDGNGLEISFAVLQNDFSNFSGKLPDVFTHFKLRPEIKGNSNIEIPEITYDLSGESWALRDLGEKDGHSNSYNRSNRYREQPYAIMGNVAYPITLEGEDPSPEQNAILNSAFDIRFDIGELEVAASRESLSYNKATIKAIKIKLNRIVKEIQGQVAKKLDAAPTLWDARIIANDLSGNKYYNLRNIFDAKGMQYKGKDIEGGLSGGMISLDSYKDKVHVKSFGERTAYRRRSRFANYGQDKVISHEDAKAIQVKEEIKFFLNDLSMGSHVRCRQVIQDETNDITHVHLVTEIQKGQVQKLMDMMGYEETILPISTIIRDKKARQAGNGSTNPKNSKRLLPYESDVSQHDRDEPSSYWQNEKVDIRNGGLYVEIDRYQIRGDFARTAMQPFFDVLTFIGEDPEDYQVIGVKASMVGKVYENDKWSSFFEVVKTKMKEYLADNNLEGKVASYLALHDSLSEYGTGYEKRNMFDHCQKWDIESDTSAMGLFVAKLNEAKEIEQLAKKIRDHSHRLGINLNSDKNNIKELDDMYDTVMLSYPMLAIFGSNYGSELKLFSEYVNMIDKSRAAGIIPPAPKKGEVKKD